MSNTITLDLMFICQDYKELLRSLIRQGIVSSDKPIEVQVHHRALSSIPDDWVGVERNLATIGASWANGNFVRVVDRDLVSVKAYHFNLDMVRLVERLSGVEFEVANIGNFQFWGDSRPRYTPSQGPVGPRLGSAFAYRGRGHGRAMSRRWIERGPWRVLRGENDTTLTQFHDEAADANLSVEQARPCHELMSDEAQAPLPTRMNYEPATDLSGAWLPDSRQLMVTVAGRIPTRAELRDAVATRFYQLLGKSKPVDNVVYSFAYKEELDAVIGDLWLYGLEARLRDAAGWHRMDDKFDPPPVVKPAWVRELGRDDHL